MTGIKKDQGKNRWDLLPFEVIEWAVKTMTFGASKYGENNWKKVENAEERYFAALMRHLVAYRSGERYDQETSYPHLAHALCCLIFMFWFSLNKLKTDKNPKVEIVLCKHSKKGARHG